MDVFTKLEDALRDSIVRGMTVMGKASEVTFSHENGPEPVSDYISVNVLDMTQTGGASKSGLASFGNGQAREYATRHYEALVQLNFFGEGSSETAMIFHSQWRSNTVVREQFLRNKLAPRSISNMRRAPQLRDTVWVKSFTVDIKVGFSIQTVQDVDWVDFVTLNGTTVPLTKQ